MRADATVWVQKFGGTSVADAGLIRDAAERIETRRSAGHHVVVVVSAMGDTTDRLLAIARQVSDHPPRRELDVLLSAGEIQSMALLAIALERRGIDAISFTGAQGGVFTDDHHSQARITKIATERVEAELERGRVVVLAGFQGVTHDDHVTTLGRGGSDTSAVAMAAALGAKCCEILTDVPGVFTADPRVVPTARLLDEITYDEMLEMATFGARVLHNRAVDLAARYRVPLIVGPAHGDAPGTRVVAREKAKAMEAPVVRAITEDPSVQKISFLEVPDRPGIAAQVFALLGGRGIPLRLIVQAQSHAGHNDITFVAPSEIEVPDELLDDVVRTVGGRTTLRDPNVGLLSVVGDGIAGAPGMVGRIFQVLADAEINIDLISSSNLVITCCVPQAQLQRGARALHAALIES
ncbi:MAG: aspartate kinase [Planctomycetes bacterium]|nr:aspartate kinase [Planctomycetota bacterium]